MATIMHIGIPTDWCSARADNKKAIVDSNLGDMQSV